MTLEMALRETGKARRQYWAPKIYVSIDGLHGFLGELEELSVVSAIATDWEPYHDPPKEKRLRRGKFADGASRLCDWPGCPEVHTKEWGAVEVSPERDEIVKRAVTFVTGDPLVPYENRQVALELAVRLWEKAGRPA